MVITVQYEILDETNQVVNVIVADQDFVEEHYPGCYRELIEDPKVEAPEQVEQRLIAEAGAKAAVARVQRNALLAQTDWAQVVDTPQSLKDKWAPYRQALRDVPQQEGFPETVVWPTQPE